jgi:LDH2 family malate/lactate/ureidoglycolate dehydrogenase
MEKMVQQIRESARVAGNDKIYLPGEIEFITERERIKKGIPLDSKLVSELNEIATQLRVKPLKF